MLLSFLVLMVIIAIVYQLNRVTVTDKQVADRDFTSTNMDLAIESALLEVMEQLQMDGEMKMSSEDTGDEAATDVGSMDPSGGFQGEGDDNPDAVDSFMDEWSQIAATSINELDLRILIVDEDRKYNILNLLVEDLDLAQEALERVERILDMCREGTEADIDGALAAEMARAMQDHMLERNNSFLPRPTQMLSDDEENPSLGMPLTMREFIALEPFSEDHFRDFFDENGDRVHSIDSYLTIYSSPFTEGDEQSDSEPVDSGGGYGVNVNTAPLAVLHSLLDSRDVDSRFWEDVLQYRNTEEAPEPDDDTEDIEPMLDEFGEDVVPMQIFDSLDELNEVPGYDIVQTDARAKVDELLRVDSNVFSVFITARKVTLAERFQVLQFSSRREQEEYERSGAHMVRTVRSVVWRKMGADEVEMVPLLRWDVLDYAPLPVLDYPDEEY